METAKYIIWDDENTPYYKIRQNALKDLESHRSPADGVLQGMNIKTAYEEYRQQRKEELKKKLTDLMRLELTVRKEGWGGVSVDAWIKYGFFENSEELLVSEIRATASELSAFLDSDVKLVSLFCNCGLACLLKMGQVEKKGEE